MKSKSSGKLRVFVTIPYSLRYIADKDSIIILNYIYCQIKNNRNLVGGYVPFSKEIGLRVSDNYLKSLTSLLESGVLEASSHCGVDGKKTYYSKRLGIPQHFRFSKMEWERIRGGKLYNASFFQIFRLNKGMRDEYFVPDYYSDIQKLLGKVYNELPIECAGYWNLYRDENTDGKLKCFLSDKIMENGIMKSDFKITAGDTGRVFHPMVMMDKRLRKHVTVRGETLVEVDTKSLHPYLLAHFGNDEDKRRWLSVMSDGDFYQIFVDEKHDRNSIKQVFQKAISNCEGYGRKASEIREFIEKEAPSIFQWIVSCGVDVMADGKDGNTCQFKLQSLEGEIFIQGAFRKLCGAGVWAFAQHDGFSCLEADVDAVGAILDECLRNHLGYRVPIDRADTGEILNPDNQADDVEAENMADIFADVFEGDFQLMGNRWLYLSDGVWIDSEGNCEIS